MRRYKGNHPYPIVRKGFNCKFPYLIVRSKYSLYSYRVKRYIECVLRKHGLSFRDFHHRFSKRGGIGWCNKYWILNLAW